MDGHWMPPPSSPESPLGPSSPLGEPPPPPPFMQEQPPLEQPFIPENLIDVPSQRLYILSLGLVCQAVKLFDFIQSFTTPAGVSKSYGIKWLTLDLAYCVLLAQLRIPRLNYSKSIVLLHILILWFLNGLLFGGIQVHLWSRWADGEAAKYSGQPLTPESFRLADILSPLGLGFLFPSKASIGRDAHLLGQHTVRMSPISTAQLNPDHLTFCLDQAGSTVLVPVLLNNTDISHIKYSVIPLGYRQDLGENDKINKAVGKLEHHELTKRDLKVTQQIQEENARLSHPTSATRQDGDDFDEYDEEESESGQKLTVQSSLQKTQSLQYIRITKPGTLRLERVVDISNVDARISYPPSLTVVPCPRVEFAEDRAGLSNKDYRCHGHDRDLDLNINIYGVPPLTLKWFKDINGRREHLVVEGIEGDGHHTVTAGDATVREVARRVRAIPQDVKIPLSVPLDTLGDHLYALEEIMDGLGNLFRVPEALLLDSRTANNTKTARVLTVLRRPAFAFQGCGPGNPTPLLIGSDTPLSVSAKAADSLDAPWEIVMKYVPPAITEEGGKGTTRRPKPWQRTMRTQAEEKQLIVHATAPGEYTILGVKGKWCQGDVLAPETCKVFERPMPTAVIEWKRIHECSGDTGVSASIVFHGTPPFTLYYRTQRNKEAPRELTKIFPMSRGELTLQPPHSGHYTYTPTHVSDAYYTSVPLKVPSIDQVVHPLAAAVILDTDGPGNRRTINSCSGNMVDVEVELFGHGPWNLEVQVVSPKNSDIIRFPGITDSRKTLQITIPAEVDRDGGSFEVALATIEDANGCKRSLNVPGITVNVRRVKPTARFYGSEDSRHVTILAGERAGLPLRLTGEGPWRIVYQHTPASGNVKTIMEPISSPNGHLDVTDPGHYKIVSVADSQCPGTVLAGGDTYTVDWVPQPFAKLSPRSEAVYERYNRSHILPSVCEGMDDNVDLELTGRPPFQITYNVARGNELGGTDLIDQATFNSIQPRTRFQLRTSRPGRLYYEVKQIGDAAYPLKKQVAPLPLSDRLLFEQQVLQRPTAQFKSTHRLTYCLHDTLTPRGVAQSDGVISLEGAPPFTLELTIKSMSSSEVQRKTVQTMDRLWHIDLPSYSFSSIGPHLLKIESVRDASNCEQAPPDALAQRLWIDVAETATIVPIDRKEVFCVGDVARFHLEGLPPFSIGYRINGKSFVHEAKSSPFSILQQQAGEFAITSIAHQQKMCRAGVTDLRFPVHALPSAQVGHGKRIYQDIHEGDQAEIVFSLFGEPPFTFTYQRSESPMQPGGRPGKVLETHTVSGITAKEYTIYSALEGTWTVASISDRYCRYPPVQPDPRTERSRH